MPKKTITTTQEVIEDERSLDGVMKSLGPDGGWIIKIYRRVRNASDDWLGNFQPGEISEQMLAEEFGAGKYIVRPWSETENKWGPSKTVTISADARGVAPASAVHQVAADHGQSSLLQVQLQMMQQNSDRQMQMMQQFNTSMLSIVTAMITSQKPQDLGAMVSLMKEVGGGGGGLGMFKEAIGLVREMMPNEGGGGGDASPWSVLSSIVPRLIENKALPPAPAGVAAQPGAAAVATAPPPDQEQERMKERIAFLNRLKKMAGHGKDVQLWADYIDDNQDIEEPCKWILDVARNHSWVEVSAGLAKFDPDIAIAPFNGWFAQLYKELRGEGDRADDEGKGSTAE